MYQAIIPSITTDTNVAAASSDENDGLDALSTVVAAAAALRGIPTLWNRVKRLLNNTGISELVRRLTDDYNSADTFTKLLHAQSFNELAGMVESLLHTQIATPRRNNITASDVAVSIGFLRNAWQRKYSGPAMDTFCRYLTQLDTMFDENRHYS